MTDYPPPSGQGSESPPQPDYGQQQQYGQPQYGQPQYGQPQYGQPQYGAPPQYGPSQPYGAAPYDSSPYGAAPAYAGYGGYGAERPHGGLATAALVLGIIGFVLAVIPFVNYVAYPIVVLAIIFGIIARQWGKAKAGLILGVLGLIATVVWTIAFAVLIHHVSHQVNRFNNCIDNGHSYTYCSNRYPDA